MKSLAIARTQFKRFARSRQALFFSVALPIVLIFLIGTATSGFNTTEYPIGVVAGDGKLATALVHALDASHRIEVKRYDDRDAMAKDVRRGVVPAGVVIPTDYDAQLTSGHDVDVELVQDQTRGSPAAVRSVISGVIADQGSTLQAAIFASARTRRPITVTLADAKRTTALFANVAVGITSTTVGHSTDEGGLAPGIGYQAPSNLILFVFITSVAGSALLIQSRQLRVVERMYATPTRARTIVAGEGLARLAIAGGQALLIFTVGVLVFGVNFGDPVGAAALIVLFVLVGTSFGLLVGTVFRTPEQAGSIGPMAGIAMGMLGGCMWPLEIVPKPMRELGHLFPHAWAMDAWIELIGRGGGIGDIAKQLAVLAGFVVVLFPVATWRLRRAVVA